MMTKRSLVLSVLVFACSSEPTTPGGGGDDAPPPGEPPPPFTDGVSMLSGHAIADYVDGPRGTARFSNPVNLAYGPDGKLYVADFDNHKVRVVDAIDGVAETLIDESNMRRPFGMAFAADGTLYVTTDMNSSSEVGPMTGSIWRIEGRAVSLVAENIGRPRGIVVLPDGRLAVSDYQHHVIELVDASTGAVTVLAGTFDMRGMANGSGAAARFAAPYGMALVDGALVVADHENNQLREVTLTGTVTTLAGSTAGFANGALAEAKFTKPQGVAVTVSGDLYVTDLGNYRVRRIRGDAVDTVAGNGVAGYVDHDDRMQAEFFGLEGLTVSPDGAMVYVADGGRGEDVPYNRLRSIKMNP